MNIRPATVNDFPTIAALQGESWRDSYGDVMPDEYLAGEMTADLQRHWASVEMEDDDVVLIAEVENEIAGFIAVWCRPEPFIDNLHVSPTNRSQRIGSALMRAAALQLIELGHRTANLLVVENNTGAIRFYERLGGRRGERFFENLFGYEVAIIRIEWPELATICQRTEGDNHARSFRQNIYKT